MQMVSLADHLHKVSKPISGKKYERYQFIVYWIGLESGKG